MTATLTFPPPGSTKEWAGRAVGNARTWYAQHHDTSVCARCGQAIIGAWHLGHRLDRQAHPQLTWEPDNWQAEHPRCSRSAGATQENVRRGMRRAIAKANGNVKTPRRNDAAFFSDGRTDTPHRPSLIPTHNGQRLPGNGGPRFLTPPAPAATGSLWPELRPWLASEGLELRPWQELVASRACQVDSAGRLAWRTVVVSTPRMSGKSWLIKAMALARTSHPELFGGEPQLVVHVANNHLAARRIHSQAWGWAGKRGLEIRKAQGMERVIWPDGSSWDALTLSNVYGASASLVLLDEVWDVSPENYREGLRPTQVARTMPQLWALSTAHRQATGLMLSLLQQGRNGEGRTLLADWGAGVDDDPMDPAVWEAASPWWDAQREDEMRLAAGSQGFAEQWLNVWPEGSGLGGWLPDGLVAACARESVAPAPLVAAVEVDMDQASWSAAVSDGSSVATIAARPLPDVVAWLSARMPPVVLGHSAALGRPELAGVGAELVAVKVHQVASAASEFADAVRGGTVSWDNPGLVAEQLANVVLAQVDGLRRIVGDRSRGDVSLVKAMTWALWYARQNAPDIPMVY